MHIEFLLEELSAEAALMNLVPKIVGPEVSFVAHPHQGKQDLFKKLPLRLRAYREFMPADWRIVVLLDEDRGDCRAIKREMEIVALRAGLMTKTAAAPGERFRVLNRLAIEELEAWFLGDVRAVATAYPDVPARHLQGGYFRRPDAVSGGTWEALQRVLRRGGYHRGGLAKVRAAREISRFMDPNVNRSPSFQVFRDGLREMCR